MAARLHVYGEVLLCLIAIFGESASSAEISIADLESKILSSRRAIHSYDVSFDVDEMRGGKSSHGAYELWSSGKNRRQKINDDRGIAEVCINDKIGFYYSSVAGQFANSDRSKWPAVRIDGASSTLGNPTYRMQDPMVVMFSSYFFSWNTGFGLEKFVNAPNRIDLTESPSSWHGNPSVKVSFRFSFVNTRFEYEAVPSLGNSIVEFRGSGERTERDGRKAPFEVACICTELKEVAPSIWFPIAMHETKAVGGNVEDDERIRVSFKTVNSVIPDRTFQIDGLGLPAGVLIVDNTKPWHDKKSATTHPSVLVWDGKDVKPWTSVDSASVAMSGVPVLKPRSGGTLKWRIWASSFLLAAGIGLMSRYIWSLREKRQPNES